jgi:hypothetical protein
MAARKGVHFDLDDSLDLGLPSLDADSSVADTAAANMHFINAQLLAHGFAHSGGLSVDGLAVQDMEKLAKCLISMLGQRTVRGSLCMRMGS